MRKVVFYMMAAALLSGCNARNENIMQIEEQGSFAVGGTVLTDSLGRTYHGDHAYVLHENQCRATGETYRRCRKGTAVRLELQYAFVAQTGQDGGVRAYPG